MPTIATKPIITDWLEQAHMKWAMEEGLTEDETALDLEIIQKELRVLESKNSRSYEELVRSAKLRYENARRTLPFRGSGYKAMQ